MNILYLSDIHFGRELLAHGRFTRREHIQSQLIQTVSELPENMHPHYIVVTGDIAWTGAAAEYEMAYAWFSELLSALGLDGEKITFCAGNHDINRKIAVQIPIAEIKDDNGFKLDKIDELYRYENINSYNVQIHAYNDFCHRLGVIPYEYRCEAESPVVDKFGFSKQWYSYTVGSKDIIFGSEKYRIVGFNTAMLSGYEEMPDDETFLGLPQVEQMISEHVIGKETGRYTVALFHHAERFLNTNEMNSYRSRPASLYKLLENVDLALCGHTETGAVPVPKKQGEGGILVNGGAAYYSDNHPNSFSILRLDANAGTFDSCTFTYKNGNWISYQDLSGITWKKQVYEMRLPGGRLADQTWKVRFLAKTEEKELLLRHVDYGIYINGSEIH